MQRSQAVMSSFNVNHSGASTQGGWDMALAEGSPVLEWKLSRFCVFCLLGKLI